MAANPSGCCRVPVDCCAGDVADTLTATIHSVSACECAAGDSIPLAWDGQAWSGQKVICGRTWQLSLDCGGDLWGLNLTGCEFHTRSPASVNCDPLLVEFQGFELTTCCDGWSSIVNILVTE